eukprot:g17345.t1
MLSKSATLRKYIEEKTFLHMPAVYDPMSARIAQQVGFEVAYVGGYVTGGSRAITEPLLSMSEQIDVAADVAASIDIPLVVDGGAGFGEPLHTMRTVREFIRADVSCIHIEDQLYPKRAHYHKYQVHAIPTPEFVTKIKFACRARDEADKDFMIIARTDTCREFGLQESADRLNAVADSGAELGLLFPRNPDETERAPKVIDLPLVYVMSRGNRDGRPVLSAQDIKDMGYAGIIDAQASILPAFKAIRSCLTEMRETGSYTGMTTEETVEARQSIEDIIGLEEFYEIEAQTVEGR